MSVLIVFLIFAPLVFSEYLSSCLEAPLYGQYGIVNSSNPRYFSHCEPCPMGTFSISGNTTYCTDCQPGTFNLQIGQSVCVECGIDTHTVSAKGAKSCEACPIVIIHISCVSVQMDGYLR